MSWLFAALFMAVTVLLATGLLAVLCGRHAILASILGAGGAVVGCAIGLAPAVSVLAAGSSEYLVQADGPAAGQPYSWHVPYGSLAVGIDPLSALFLTSALTLAGLAAVFGGRFLMGYADRKLLGPPWFFFNVLVAGMICVLVARNGVLFLVSWEVMSLASYFLVTFENEKPAVREAGRLYLIAMHLGVAFLLAFFVLLGQGLAPDQPLDFTAIAASPSTIAPSVLFLLALVGFGTKAGLMPLHVSLPEAEPVAPSHAAAVMSGAMIKMGIYGLLRTIILVRSAPVELESLRWWGELLIVVGIVSGVWGILFALAQSDLSKALAYSSIENEGIIALGIGSGLLALGCENPALATLGFAGALFHVVNHGMFKGLLFLGAGAIQQSTGTRHVDRLGGLIRKMPLVGVSFLVATAAISAIPPLNGFMGEFLIYLGAYGEGELFGAAPASAALAVIASLALIGGLALATFAKIFGIAFLGAAHARGGTRNAPELAACLAAGAAGRGLRGTGARRPAVAAETGAGAGPADRPGRGNHRRTNRGRGLVADEYRTRGRRAGRAGGRARHAADRAAVVARGHRIGHLGLRLHPPDASHAIHRVILCPADRRFLLHVAAHPEATGVPRGLFPGEAALVTETADVPHQYFYRPIYVAVEWLLSKFRWLQHGHAHLYVLYVGVTLVTLLIWYINRPTG